MKGYTFAEKILNAPAGTIVYREPDIVMSQDYSAQICKLFRKMGGTRVSRPEQMFVVLDQRLSGEEDEMIRDYNTIRGFMEEQQVEHFFDNDKGICHQVVARNIYPGMLVVGSDSHTVTAGAFNCFATGISNTDTAFAWKQGNVWFRVPETIKIVLNGRLRQGVYAKDLALWVMGMLREEFPDYKCVEYHGEGVSTLLMEDRQTIANVSAEMGLKNAVFPPDDILANYYDAYAVKGVWADEGAVYCKEFEVDLGVIPPLVMLVHDHHEVKSVVENGSLEVQQGMIGGCASGSLEDLRVVARILKGKKLFPGFQLIVIPATYEIYIAARNEGLVEDIVKAGAFVSGASCRHCLGSSYNILHDTKRFISTINSGAMQKMSEIGVEKYIASPATVAMTALSGRIAAEQEYPEEHFPFWNNPVESISLDEFDRRKYTNVWNYSDINYISCKQLFPYRLAGRISPDQSEAMKPYVLSGLDSRFASNVATGDVLLAGESFGSGRLLKQAALGLKSVGIKAVLAKSVNRNFFRLAINTGLTVFIVPELVEAYRNGDILEVDLDNHCVYLNEVRYALPLYDRQIEAMRLNGGLAEAETK